MAEPYFLAAGRHRRPGGGRCAMEWVAYLAGEEHSDAPRSVSPVLAAFARSWNDALDDEPRQRLRPYLARTIGTAGDGEDERRAWLCADWLVRTCAPALLEHAGLGELPCALRDLPPLGDERGARSALPAVLMAAGAAQRARVAARAAARRGRAGLALQAATDGARQAARSAPRAAGWVAARAALRAAAPCARRDAVAEAACCAARDATWAAAWSAGAAPWVGMRPVAEDLQRSAFALLDRLLPGVLLDPEPLALARAAR